MEAATRCEIISGGPLTDAPDHYMITVRLEGDDEREWTFVRKPDGTYWEVVGTDLFPRTGGILRVDLGDQIVDPKALALCERHYGQIRDAETARLKVLGLRKVRNTEPQKYELRLFDTAEETRGYFQTTRYGTEEEIRAMMKDGGLPEGQIDFYLGQAP
ncbi:MAG: hypothetical protein ABSE40_00080 [Candidatus Sulfotelmatobacter sp.]